MVFKAIQLVVADPPSYAVDARGYAMAVRDVPFELGGFEEDLTDYKLQNQLTVL